MIDDKKIATTFNLIADRTFTNSQNIVPILSCKIKFTIDSIAFLN